MPETEIKTFAPANEQAAAEFLREVSAKKQAVRLSGGQTKSNFGGLYTPTNLELSACKLTDLIDYQPEDLTITVGAGMPFEQLQQILGAQGQFLALDPPTLAGQTIGGLLATNRSGPRRLLYGTLRDLLIGCRYVLADGTRGLSGGRVVKNVAGYDLHKLFIGAFGTLAFLTEVTFKVTPLPKTRGVAIAHFASHEQALAAARLCVRSNLLPAFLEVLPGHQLYFGAEGVAVAVAAQLEKLGELCRQAGALEIVTPPDFEAELYRLANFLEEKNTLLRVSTLLTELPTVAKEAAQVATELGLEISTQIRAGNGLLYVGLDLPEAKEAAFTAAMQSWRSKLAAKEGYLVIEKAAASLKNRLNVWGDFGTSLAPMQKIKQQLDPQGLLNPGRLPF